MIVQLENEEHPLIIRNGKQIVIPRTARKYLLRDVLGTNWLVAVDRYSGYAWTAKIAKATRENTLTQLVAWFDKFGWPKKIRSDGGPQFRQAFTSFCKLHGISHELASAYNPESKGLAEAAVKA